MGYACPIKLLKLVSFNAVSCGVFQLICSAFTCLRCRLGTLYPSHPAQMLGSSSTIHQAPEGWQYRHPNEDLLFLKCSC